MMIRQCIAFLLVLVFFNNPLLAASAEPTVVKETVTLSNALNLVPPTNAAAAAAAAKSTHNARKAITKNWATWVNANSAKLAVAESALLSNRSALITTAPSAKPLYVALQAAGSNLTLKQVQAMSASTAEQRQRIFNVVETQGLSPVLSGLTNNQNPFASGPQPADGGGYCYLEALGNDILAFAAILAFLGQEEAALALAAVGAALYFYGEYISCTIGSTGDDGGDFFVTDND